VSDATRVLLVDDADGPRITLAGLLELEGFVVVEAASLAEGRVRARERGFRVAIVDLQLGDGDGRELIAELTREQPGVLVAVLSGQQVGDVRGARLTLTKSESPDAMLTRLRAALEHHG
jgi:DNA-binding response OmpR family regulator